jgi:hypothetical protein
MATIWAVYKPISAAYFGSHSSKMAPSYVGHQLHVPSPSKAGAKLRRKPSVFQFFSVFEQQTVSELVPCYSSSLCYTKPFKASVVNLQELHPVRAFVAIDPQVPSSLQVLQAFYRRCKLPSCSYDSLQVFTPLS